MNDWLEVETPDDWLSTEPVAQFPAVIEKPALSMQHSLPESAGAKLSLLQECWDRLDPRQRIFLDTLRTCRWNQRAACRALETTANNVPRSTLRGWLTQADFSLCYKVLKADDAGAVLDPDKLLLRQEDIVEQLMTPTAILHQGLATGYFENHAAQASKANEVLLDRALPKKVDAGTRHVVRFVNLAGPEVAQAIEVTTEIE